MPSSAEQRARRQVVAELRSIGGLSWYAASVIGNGASPRQAEAAAAEAAAELEASARKLRRLTGRPVTPAEVRSLDKAARCELAAELTAAGLSRSEVAGRLAVCPRTVRKYLRQSRPDVSSGA